VTVRARGALAGLLAAAIALCACVAALAGGLSPNPANDPRLLDKPIEGFRYDHARGCRDEPPRGMRAFQRWLNRNVRGTSWGIMRCERLRGGGNYSLHSEGRAIDWHLDARRRTLASTRTATARTARSATTWTQRQPTWTTSTSSSTGPEPASARASGARPWVSAGRRP
jgi:hypothetical protein